MGPVAYAISSRLRPSRKWLDAPFSIEPSRTNGPLPGSDESVRVSPLAVPEAREINGKHSALSPGSCPSACLRGSTDPRTRHARA